MTTHEAPPSSARAEKAEAERDEVRTDLNDRIEDL